MLNRDEDILKAAENWQKAGHGVALATVVETWGSAPRPAGAPNAGRRPRGRAPGLDHGCQRHAVSGLLPVLGGLQNVFVAVEHVGLSFRRPNGCG